MNLDRIQFWIKQFEADREAIKQFGFSQELYLRYEEFKQEIAMLDLENDKVAYRVWQQIKDIIPRNLERFYSCEVGSLVAWYHHKCKLKQA